MKAKCLQRINEETSYNPEVLKAWATTPYEIAISDIVWVTSSITYHFNANNISIKSLSSKEVMKATCLQRMNEETSNNPKVLKVWAIVPYEAATSAHLRATTSITCPYNANISIRSLRSRNIKKAICPKDEWRNKLQPKGSQSMNPMEPRFSPMYESLLR